MWCYSYTITHFNSVWVSVPVSPIVSISHLHWTIQSNRNAFLLPALYLSAHNLWFPEITWLVSEGVGEGICQLICLITIISNKCIFPLAFVHMSVRPSPCSKFILVYIFLPLVPAVVSLSVMLMEYQKICLPFLSFLFFFFCLQITASL